MQKNNSHQKTFQNKRAFFDYNILERLEVGVELKSDEVKMIRLGKVQLQGAFGRILIGKTKKPELFVAGLYIGSENIDPQRMRKLLVHKNEIQKLIGKTQEKGLTLIPTKMYFKRGKVKLGLGVARAKKKWDKRAAIREREQKQTFKKFQN